MEGDVYGAEVYESTDNESEYSTSVTGESQGLQRRQKRTVHDRRLDKMGMCMRRFCRHSRVHIDVYRHLMIFSVPSQD